MGYWASYLGLPPCSPSTSPITNFVTKGKNKMKTQKILVFEENIDLPPSARRFSYSAWAAVLEKSTKMKEAFLTTRQPTKWLGVSGFASRSELESCRSAINSHARRMLSKEQGWVFETTSFIDEPEGIYKLYTRVVTFKMKVKIGQ